MLIVCWLIIESKGECFMEAGTISRTSCIRPGYRLLLMKSSALSCNYSPQTKFAKVMFLQVSVCPQGRACMVSGRGGMHGCCWGACMVAGGGVCMVAGGHAWLLAGGVTVHACWGRCVWLLGGVRRISWDMVNEWAVRILLECILVENCLTESHCLRWIAIGGDVELFLG